VLGYCDREGGVSYLIDRSPWKGLLVRPRISVIAIAAVLVLVIQPAAAVLASAAAPRCNGKLATKVGTAQSETIRGTQGNDVIVARGGNDLIFGRGGKDVICGSVGFDQILGGGGNDKLFGGNDTDFLNGGAGTNTIDGQGAGDWAYYAASSVPVQGDLDDGEATSEGTDIFVSIEALWGSVFDDQLFGSDDGDTIFGGAGNDTIDGRAGLLDFLAGDAGDDQIIGGTGGFAFDVAYYRYASEGVNVDLDAGTATSGADTDTLDGIEGAWGSDFNDVLRGDEGKNPFAGSEGDDIIDGRGEFDVVIFWVSPDGVNVDLGAETAFGEGSDNLIDIEGVSGSPVAGDILVGDGENNYLDGYGGNDALSGLGGDDWLSGGAGIDQIDGGPGTNDLAEFYETSPVTADLSAGTATGEGDDTMAGIEALFGTLQGDHLIGDDGPNAFFGSDGDDLIEAGGGDDLIDGGLGFNDLFGQDGTDNCVSGPNIQSCEGATLPPIVHPLYLDVLAASAARRNF
jgi:Ca2+-binding RTX toxin-like protein